ncbi:hypothetical protein CsSME_00027018 [Camellia sinensis var. sinensis]
MWQLLTHWICFRHVLPSSSRGLRLRSPGYPGNAEVPLRATLHLRRDKSINKPYQGFGLLLWRGLEETAE